MCTGRNRMRTGEHNSFQAEHFQTSDKQSILDQIGIKLGQKLEHALVDCAREPCADGPVDGPSYRIITKSV